MAPIGRQDLRSRGQLILVAGLGLAVTLVALALILNSAIYTENLASRNIESAGADAVQARGDVQAGVTGVFTRVNGQPAPDYSQLDSDYKTGVTEWNQRTSRFAALDGASVKISDVKVKNGVRVTDENTNSGLLPATALASSNDWTVAQSVRARAFTITAHSFPTTISETTVESDIDDSNPSGFFFIDVDDGDGNDWRLAIYDDSGTVKVTVHDEDGGTPTQTCAASGGSPVTVNLAAATVDGSECPAISSIADETGPYDIDFQNGDQISGGTFDLTVDRVIDGPSVETGPFTDVVDTANYDADGDTVGDHCGGPTYYDADSGNSPYVVPTLYASTLDMSYRSQQVEYTSDFRIASGELSEGSAQPKVVAMSVSDSGSSFTVSGDVSDPDGDLQEVSLEIVNPAGGTASASVSGESSSYSLSAGATSGTKHTVKITVKDDAGNTRVVTQRHVADGDGTGNGSCPE